VVFHGNKSIAKKELLKHIATQPAALMPWGARGKYDRKAFEQDLERLRLLYQTRGFLDVKVAERPFQISSREAESKWKQQKMMIHIDIEEGEIYHIGKIDFKISSVEGTPAQTADSLRGLLTIMPGEVYDAQKVSQNAGIIRDHYGENGRYFSTVRPRRVTGESGAVADIVFEVKEDRPVVVEDILITGLVNTKEFVVRRELEMFPGEVYNTKKKRETEWNLNRLNYFERPVKIDVKKTGEGRGKVVVDLKEKRTGSISGGVGYSTADGIVGNFKLKERNFDHRGRPKNLKELLTLKAFKGAGEMLSLDISAGSNASSYALDFMNPWVFNRALRFGTGVYRKTRDWDYYDETRTGGYVSLGRKIFGKIWDLTGTYKVENVLLDDFEGDFSDEFKEENGDRTVARGILRLAYDTRDDMYDPTDGWYGTLSQEVAGGMFGGEADFWRTRTEVNYWHTFFRDKSKRPHVIALRVEGAAADSYGRDNDVPINEKLYAGGLGSLRGFSYHSVSPQRLSGDSIGGLTMATSSVEYLFPLLGDNVRGSVFYDVGNVWEKSWDFDGDNWRSSTGLGLHVKTPLWQMPIGIYYSSILEKEEFDDRTKTVQIRMGAYF
jgi:outer membrane protein insertion porin family